MKWLKRLVGGDKEATRKRKAPVPVPAGGNHGGAPAAGASGDGDDVIDIAKLAAATRSRWEKVDSGLGSYVIMETAGDEDGDKYRKLLVHGEKRHPIRRESLIGRHSQCKVIVRGDPEVSRQHCSVRVAEDGGLEVRDHGSVNGTYINGHPVRKDRWNRLAHGDRLNVGSRIAFFVVIVS